MVSRRADRMLETMLDAQVRDLEAAAVELAGLIRAEALKGNLSVREAARITGWSKSKVDRVIQGDARALTVPVRAPRRRETPGQLSLHDQHVLRELRAVGRPA